MLITTENKLLVEQTERLAQKLDMSSEESEYVFNGRKIPRVTKIIQRCDHSDGLMHWANALGYSHQSYGKVLNEAAAIGAQCHTNIDLFLTDNSHKPENIMEEARNAYNSFRRWYSDISKSASVEVVAHEKQLTCSIFGGTMDGLYRINGRNYIVDYKTSNHIAYKHFLQLAAYIYMLETSYVSKVDGAVILQLSKVSVAYNEYTLNFEKTADANFINQCGSGFLSMVHWYYHLIEIEQSFKKIKWGLS